MVVWVHNCAVRHRMDEFCDSDGGKRDVRSPDFVAGRRRQIAKLRHHRGLCAGMMMTVLVRCMAIVTMREFAVECGMQRRLDPMRFEQATHDANDRGLERRSMRQIEIGNTVVHFVPMPVGDSRDHRLAIGKVLIKRANTYPRLYRNGVGRQRLTPMCGQNVSSGVQYSIDQRARPGLPGVFPWIEHSVRHGPQREFPT